MHTIRLNVQDSIYSHIIFLLKNLNSKELEIVEDKVVKHPNDNETSQINAFSNHSANLIDEWKDDSEDEVWK